MPAAAAMRGDITYSGRSRRVAVLRCLVAAVVVTVLLAGLFALVFWLVVRPRPIDYTVTHAMARHFNVTPPSTNPSATAVNATFYLAFAAHNPNRRVSVLYEWVEFRVLYGAGGSEEEQLAVEDYAPAPFWQPRRNKTVLEVRAVARSARVGEQTARELRHDLELEGEVGLDVRARARVQFKVAGVRSRRYYLQAFCSPVVVSTSSASAAKAFQSVPCDVGIS